MAITITMPAPAPIGYEDWSDEEQALDVEGDVEMGSARSGTRSKFSKAVVTPGEIVTDDPQWMR